MNTIGRYGGTGVASLICLWVMTVLPLPMAYGDALIQVVGSETIAVDLGKNWDPDPYAMIAFLLEDDIWLTTENYKAINLTGSGKVFSFACDPDIPGLLYYSVLGESLDLWVYTLSLVEGYQSGCIGMVPNETHDTSYFVTDTYGERAQMEVDGAELKIECDFRWGLFRFTEVAVIDLSSIKGDPPPPDTLNTGLPDILITHRMVNGIAELFCTVGDGSAYQLSRTGAMTRFDEFYLRYAPSFSVSPSGKKVLFSLITDFGDLAHGPLLIVNIDGTNQTVLLSDMMLTNFNHRWVGDILFFTYYSYEGQAEWLYMLEGPENIPSVVVAGGGLFDVIIPD